MKKQLNQRQYNFCINYINNGFNAYDAALNAGYSLTYAKARAHELVNHPAIQEHLNASCKQAMNTLQITYEAKIKILQEIINAFMEKNTESLTPQNAKVVIQAINVLNEMQSHNAPAKKLSVTIDATREKLQEARRQYEEY